MFTSLNMQHQQIHDPLSHNQLCIETTNLKLNDNLTSGQIEQSNLINLNSLSTNDNLTTPHQTNLQYTSSSNNLNQHYQQTYNAPEYNNFNSTELNSQLNDNLNSNLHSNLQNSSTQLNNNDLNNINNINYTSSSINNYLDLDQNQIQQQQQLNLQTPLPIDKIKVEIVQNENMSDSNSITTNDTTTRNQVTTTSQSTKICRVCGDKSLGYNFSQVTCESCKKCRLKKCFDIGMKKEWILSDEEKKLKRLKIEENKRKRKNKQLTTSPYAPSPYTIENSTANTFINGNTQSNTSPPNSSPYTQSSLQANSNSTVMSNGYNSNGLNPILYSQIDDSNMTNSLIMESTPQFNNLDKNYQSNNYFNNYNYPLGTREENFQQPEIVSQLVYSHYEQYKSSPEFGSMPTFSYSDPSSPIQYSSSFNSNSVGINTDQFFNDSTNSPSTFNSSTPISSISSPLDTLSISSNNQQQQETLINTQPNDRKNTEQQGIYSSEINQLHNNQQITQSNNKSSKPNLTLLNNLLINCLPDNLMIDEIFEQAIASKLRPSCDCKSSCTTDAFTKNEIEIINELIYAADDSGCAITPLSDTIAPETIIFELLRMTDYAVRKSIKLAKRISFFRNLCEEDQISALKGGSTEMMLVRTIGMYDEATDSIIKRDLPGNPSVRLDVLKSIKEEIYVEHKQMILSFKKEIRDDLTLNTILIGILLFQDRPNFQHRTTIKYIQIMYRYLLKRYIYINFSKDNIPIYNDVIQSLSKLRTLNEKYIRTYLELNADIIGPLLMEIFDF